MDSGSHHRGRGASRCRTSRRSPVGFDLTLGLGPRARLRRAREGRGDVLPLQDRALRDGAEGRRHGALHARARSGTSRTRASARATRTSTSRGWPASSSRSCSSGAGGDELFAGYPWRYYRAVVNDDFDHYVEKYYGFWQRLVPEPVHAGALPPRRLGRGRGPAHARHLPRRASRTRDAPRVARGLRQPLALLRGQDVPARAARRRGQAQHGAQARERACRSSTTTSSTSPCACRSGSSCATSSEVVRLDENEPGPKTERYFQRTRDGKLLLRQVMAPLRARRRSPTRSSRASPGPTRAGSAATASTTSGASCSRPTPRIYEFLDPDGVPPLVERAPRGTREPAAAALVAAVASSTGAGPSSRASTP